MAIPNFFSRLWSATGSTFNSYWSRLSFQHYDPGRLELGLIEQLEGSEYDPRLRARQGVVIFERMSREDSRLATALALFKRPIQAATWTVEASDDSVQRFVEDNIGLSDRPSTQVVWERVLDELLTSLEIGFSLHEVTYQQKDDMEHLRAVGFRPQLSVESFEHDGDYLLAVNQIKQLRPEKVLVRLPAQRLFYMTFNKIGADFWGRSMIRPAYRDWYFKEVLLIISMINAKRFGVPIPHARARAGMPADKKAKMQRVLENIQLDQRNAMVTGSGDRGDPDFDINFLEPERSRQMENLPLLHYFDDHLAKVCMVLFLDLGSVSSGNRALGDTFADILYNTLEAGCDRIASEVSTQLIQPLVEKNFAAGSWAKIKWQNLELHNMERFIEALARLAEVYPIPLKGADMERIFEILKMPARMEGFEDIEPDRADASHNLEGVGSSSGRPKNG